MEIREVAVIGLGTMGAGIAEVFARAGLAVTAIDMDRAPVPLLAEHATARLAFHAGGSGQ
jgi:3-hydroxybutyryl-CoA dehydrogenase